MGAKRRKRPREVEAENAKLASTMGTVLGLARTQIAAESRLPEYMCMPLDDQGRNLLTYLVGKLTQAVPGRPQTYVGYKQVHDELGLTLQRGTYGESLQTQGLNSLADWSAALALPAVTGLIIDRDPQKMRPGQGYFSLFGRRDEDYPWWEGEIRKAKSFDWSPFITDALPPITPPAIDLTDPPGREETTINRIIRDSLLARRVKQLHNYECQLCGETLKLPDGTRYAEAHHLHPLGAPHNGPDTEGNIICLCPNHHAALDYGALSLAIEKITMVPGHVINESFVRYHNEKCFGR